MNMINTGRGPLGLKPDKPAKKPRKGLRRVSPKRAAYRASQAGKESAAYLDAVRGMDCAACGRHGPSDPHHCRDRPPFDEQGLYERLPGAGITSADRDAIPLCRPDHDMFHRDRGEFHRLYGVDYQFIGTTRAAVAALDAEIDF